MSFTWYNIGKNYSNNKLRWRRKAGSWTTLTFQDGMYDYADINRYVQAHTDKVGDKSIITRFLHDHLPGCYFDG